MVRKLVLILPGGDGIWRWIGAVIDPIQRTLRAAAPDLVFYPGNDALAYECTLPSAVPIHDLMHRYESRFPEVSSGIFRHKLREDHYRKVCKHASCLLVDSHVGRQHVLESYQPDPSRVYVLPYIPARLSRNPDAESVLADLNLKSGFVFYPAQFWKHKNHEVILRALAMLKEKGQKIRAVFVGSDFNSKGDVLDLVEQLDLRDQVTILGFVSQPQLVALYQTAGALVMPTYFGPTNIPPLEAFQLDCPVIVSGIYGMREQLGDAALYIDPNDAADVARAIGSMLGDAALRTELIERGKKHAKAWNKEAFGRRLEEIIRNVIGSRV